MLKEDPTPLSFNTKSISFILRKGLRLPFIYPAHVSYYFDRGYGFIIFRSLKIVCRNIPTVSYHHFCEQMRSALLVLIIVSFYIVILFLISVDFMLCCFMSCHVMLFYSCYIMLC